MSELTEARRTHGQQHRGADLGGVLQWAALHIEAQDEALAELRAEHAAEEAERLRLESALHEAGQAIEAALASRISRVYISAALTSATPQSASARRLRGHQLLLPRL